MPAHGEAFRYEHAAARARLARTGASSGRIDRYHLPTSVCSLRAEGGAATLLLRRVWHAGERHERLLREWRVSGA